MGFATSALQVALSPEICTEECKTSARGGDPIDHTQSVKKSPSSQPNMWPEFNGEQGDWPAEGPEQTVKPGYSVIERTTDTASTTSISIYFPRHSESVGAVSRVGSIRRTRVHTTRDVIHGSLTPSWFGLASPIDIVEGDSNERWRFDPSNIS